VLIAWLYLLRKGQKAEEVGEIVGVCRRTIQRCLRWYRKGGAKGDGEVADGWLSGKAGEGLDARQREGLLRELRERGFSDDGGGASVV